MAEPKITIPITTTADTSGITKTTAAVREATAATNPWITASRNVVATQTQTARTLNDVERELRETTQAMRAIATSSESFNEARQRVERLKDELKSLKGTKDATTRSAANFGQAMMQGSRAVQDFSAAGVAGAVNNLESIATAFGLTAGAAGGITLVAVGVDLLVKNWGKIQTAFGTPEKVKAFWSAMTPDEATAKRIQDMATAQERIADAIERATQARVKGIEAESQQNKTLEEMAKAWGWIKPTDALPTLGKPKPSAEAVAAAEAQAKAEAKYKGSLQQVDAADSAFKEQQRRVDALNKMGKFDAEFQLATRDDAKKLESVENQISMMSQDVGGDTTELQKKRDEIQERIRKKRVELAAAIPTIPDLIRGLTGDPEQDYKTMQQRAERENAELIRLQNERYNRAVEAESARGELNTAEQATRDRVTIDKNNAASGALADVGLPPAPGQFQGADAAMGLTEALAAQQQAMQAGVQQAVQGLQANTGSLTEGLGSINRGLANNIGALISMVAELRGTVSSQQQQIENLRMNGVK